MRLTVPIVSAFVPEGLKDGERGGNAAGVVLHAEQFTAAQKQSIAAQIGLSETAFLSKLPGAGWHVDFFTPAAPINDCGHATVAAFSFLAQQGLLMGQTSSKELADGTVRDIVLRDGKVWMEQNAPTYTLLQSHPAGVTAEDVYAALHITKDNALPGFAPTIVSTGMPCLLVPLRDEDAVRAIVPDIAGITTLTDALGGMSIYAFSPETHDAAHDAGARMFWPAIGIPEESATGMAAGTLSCWLHDYLSIGKTSIVIEQGFLMTPPSLSLLHAELTVTEGHVSGLLVGGRARQTGTMDVHITA